jgi:hypothetical protein
MARTVVAAISCGLTIILLTSPICAAAAAAQLYRAIMPSSCSCSRQQPSCSYAHTPAKSN